MTDFDTRSDRGERKLGHCLEGILEISILNQSSSAFMNEVNDSRLNASSRSSSADGGIFGAHPDMKMRESNLASDVEEMAKIGGRLSPSLPPRH